MLHMHLSCSTYNGKTENTHKKKKIFFERVFAYKYTRDKSYAQQLIFKCLWHWPYNIVLCFGFKRWRRRHNQLPNNRL